MARTGKKEVILDNIANIEKWSKEGLTMAQMANNLGIAPSTFYKYKKCISEFKETVKKGRAAAIEQLENTMFKNAVGYEIPVKRHAKIKHCEYNENGKKKKEWEEIVEYEETEVIKGDTTAAIFLLKNWAKYANEPRAIDVREKEMQLKEKQIEENQW